MTREFPLIIALVFGLGAAVLTARWIDQHPSGSHEQSTEQQLYLDGPTAKRLSLAFNGLAADWYWMRSLQYVGRKIVAYEDSHSGHFDLQDISKIDLRLLPSLLRVATTLDPQFLRAYEYGAVILPEIDPDAAVALLNQGLAANPSSWRLYQHLGYIYWQRADYEHAANAYTAGSKIPGAPPWLAAMAARMKAEHGSRDDAREMYRRLYETSDNEDVKQMVLHHLMRLDWLDDRDAIRQVINEFRARTGHCPTSWQEIAVSLRVKRLRLDSADGSPLDPSGVPYRLISGGCDVDLNEPSKVPH
jgi:tetratricopeptide (TPR) repeat protein